MKKVLAVLFIGFTVVGAAAGERMSYGEAEYLNSCAVCHGVEGKGDGPLRDLLVMPPADLTSISKRNGRQVPICPCYRRDRWTI
jgi:mono/diheme cytochrome c family protein